MSFYRVTSQTYSQQTLKSINQHNRQLAQLQAQITTGVRLQRPSDDPTAYRDWKIGEAEVNRLGSYLSNISAVRSQLDSQVSQMISIKDLLVRASVLTQDAPSNSEPETLAHEVKALRDSLFSFANAQVDGRYLFAGDGYEQAPFVESSTSSGSVVRYQGSQSNASTLVDRQFVPDIFLAGENLFSVGSRSTTLIVGTTGAVAGPSTSTGKGFGQLQVQHVATSYAAGSGVQAGSSSAAGDTIVGPTGAHQLTIIDTSGTGAGGTVSLNDGPPIAFTNSSANLKVTGSSGEVVYIDTTAITAGFSGTVDITATGTLSTDNGITTEALTFAADQSVTHSETGAITYVDATEIRLTGQDRIEYQGTGSAFDVLDQLYRDLTNVDNLPESARQESYQRRLGEIQSIVDTILDRVNQQSATLANLDQVEARHEDAQLYLQERVEDIAGTDFAAAITDLQQTQSLLQYTYATSSQLMSTSLLDFLR